MTKALLNIHDSYNTNYSASDFSDVDFLGEETRAAMQEAGQIDKDELDAFLDEINELIAFFLFYPFQNQTRLTNMILKNHTKNYRIKNLVCARADVCL